ncbi:MAG: hypothetical protein HYU71_08025 [Bacteroidetes bacterium]|nr:hypothetical protein [Bacteroidota bacterium]
MKTRLTTLFILLGIIILTGCTKSSDVLETREEKVVGYLTGAGNKYWHLKEVYVNSVKQVLTDAQLRFTKTYTIDPANTDPARPRGSFVNSDGYHGSWKLIGGGETLYETFTNNPAGPVAINFIINDVSSDKLDIEYTLNMKTQREVYYAY